MLIESMDFLFSANHHKGHKAVAFDPIERNAHQTSEAQGIIQSVIGCLSDENALHTVSTLKAISHLHSDPEHLFPQP